MTVQVDRRAALEGIGREYAGACRTLTVCTVQIAARTVAVAFVQVTRSAAGAARDVLR